MPDFSATWKQLIADLERERDELRLKVHLAKAEAREHLIKTEEKLDELRQRGHVAKGVAHDAAGNVEDKAKELVGEIREGFARVRRLL